MIKYALQCARGHGFEAWFSNGAACDEQLKRGLVACPECGGNRLEKALMAPNVSPRTRRKGIDRGAGAARTAARSETPREAGAAPDAPVQAASVPALPPDVPREVIDLMRRLRKEVVAKADYVGPRFAEEARRIHHEETPARGIYGEATAEDAKTLLEEGVEFYPLPRLPEDSN